MRSLLSVEGSFSWFLLKSNFQHFSMKSLSICTFTYKPFLCFQTKNMFNSSNYSFLIPLKEEEFFPIIRSFGSIRWSALHHEKFLMIQTNAIFAIFFVFNYFENHLSFKCQYWKVKTSCICKFCTIMVSKFVENTSNMVFGILTLNWVDESSPCSRVFTYTLIQ